MSPSDEQSIALNALDDNRWCDYFEQTFKMPVRRHLAPAGASTSCLPIAGMVNGDDSTESHTDIGARSKVSTDWASELARQRP